MDILMALLVIAAGFITGFINTLAGSGSIISLPLLMFLGLPIGVANGTNRVGILLQSIVAMANFKRQKVFEWKEGFALTTPTILGSIAGAILATNLNERMLEIIVGFVLVGMFFMVLYKPEKWIKGQDGLFTGKPTSVQWIIFFVIGFYGGFIQIGVGFFFLAGLVLSTGFNLVKANAYKVLKVAVYTPFVLAIFIYNDQVHWLYGFILAIGSMAGAYVASSFAVSWGAKAIRYFLLAIIILACVQLFGGFTLLKPWLVSFVGGSN
jgi:uncharacterized protein